MFYDALSDSKQLKNWLGEQLQKSNQLLAALQRQQEQTEEAVAALVDKRVGAMREEVYGLRVRVDELEGALRVARAQGYGSPSMAAAAVAKGKTKAKGYQGSPVVPDAYTFPPVVDPLSVSVRARGGDGSHDATFAVTVGANCCGSQQPR